MGLEHGFNRIALGSLTIEQNPQRVIETTLIGIITQFVAVTSTAVAAGTDIETVGYLLQQAVDIQAQRVPAPISLTHGGIDFGA